MAFVFPTSPSNGQVFVTPSGVAYTYNSTNNSWAPGFTRSQLVNQAFVATAGQTVFTILGGYTPTFLDVYWRGSKLAASDFVATNGTTVSTNFQCEAGDDVQVRSLAQFTLANMVQKNSASGDTMDNVVIGSNKPAAATTTTLTTTGKATLATTAISGGTIDNTVIGGSTPASASVTALTLGGINIQNLLADGCCRLSVSSTTSLLLSPYNGNVIFINGTPYLIPSGGVSITGQTSLTASTLYYVYVYMNGTTMTLSLSTTGTTTDVLGRRNMTGNTAYRLVGMVYTNTTAAPFLDTNTFRGCASYFNRQNRQVSSGDPGSTTGSTSFIEYVGSRCVILVWADDNALVLSVGGYVNNTTANALNYISFWIGGTGGAQSGAICSTFSSTANSSGAYTSASCNGSVSTPATFTEGAIIVSQAVGVNAGVATLHTVLGFVVRI